MAGLRYSDIARELNADPLRYAPEIIGEAPNKPMSTARELRFYKKGGLAVTLQGPKKGNWRHHGHDKFGDMLDLIIYVKNLSKFDALQEAKRILGIAEGEDYKPAPRKSDAEMLAEEQKDIQRRINAAKFIWKLSGTRILEDADNYLANRGITSHRSPGFSSIRSRHLDLNALIKLGIEEKIEAGKPRPEVKFPKGLTSLVFVATKNDGTIGAVQQVILDGPKKADVPNRKRSNGFMDDAAVRFGEPGEDLDVVEGPETGLSCVQATKVPTWASLGAANFTRLPVPEGVKRIRFAMELDPSRTGIVRSLKAAHHWMARDKHVSLAVPRIDGDANDVLQQFGVEAVREDMDRAISPERNPFRDETGEILSADAIAALPVIMSRSADDALAAWKATGLPCHAMIISKESHADISSHVPEGAKKIILLKRREEEMPSFADLDGLEIRVVQLSHPLEDFYQRSGGDAVRRLIAMAAPYPAGMPVDTEELAARPEAPVIVVTGRKSLAAARSLFPTAAAIGLPVGANSADIDWSCLKGRKVYFAPAHHDEEILAAEQAAEDCLQAGAAKASIFDWPLIVPVKGGFKARATVPAGYSLHVLEQDGWTAADARLLAKLARTIMPRAETRAA